MDGEPHHMGAERRDLDEWTSRLAIDLTDGASELWTRPADPLDDLTPRRLVRLARRAHRARRRNRDRFQAMAADAGITPRRLRMLTDAWDEGGKEGIQAIGPATEPPPHRGLDPIAMAVEQIETWRRQHFPFDALDVERWRNRITVWWLRPEDDPTKPLHRQPLMQVRRTRRGRWHLYMRAAQGEWWPVTVSGRDHEQSLSDCLAHVRTDPIRQFWRA